MTRLYGPEIAIDSTRLHELRIRTIDARNYDDASDVTPDCGQIRLRDGTWKRVSQIAPSDAIAVGGKAF